jgi:D-lactate dehydrogenase (quinone)
MDRFARPADEVALVDGLRAIVGARHVVVGDKAERRFATGYRFGKGPVQAVVLPGSLVELWRTLQACVKADAIIIMQAANTGLTGGSTPNGTYDRGVVVINSMRIKGIHPIAEGRQVICLPGATLYELETMLRPLGREPHSVIGSSCIGASVVGGICNNSGGSLVQRGPAYTELALYARIDEHGELELINHLGIKSGDPAEALLERIEHGLFTDGDIEWNERLRASDYRYRDHVRKIEEPTPARFNADPSRLYEASGSAGKLALLAVRLDTFPKETSTATFYIGTNSVADLARIRADILGTFDALPIAAEYIHRDAFDLADRYGKDTVVAIECLGTARLPALFAFKARIDAIARAMRIFPLHLSDWLLQASGRFFGDHLPGRMRAFRDRYEHHLILKVGADGIGEARAYLEDRFPDGQGEFFECSQTEAAKAFLHRFAVAGAAVRYRALHRRKVEDIIALDVALRRNDTDWFEALPASLENRIISKLYYGHFLCHVFHQDYIIAKGADVVAIEHEMHALLDARGAEYPAEHNVGHLYRAKQSLVDHYRALDPCNSFNPGIGETPRGSHWRE